jgi:hypothetical protein
MLGALTPSALQERLYESVCACFNVSANHTTPGLLSRAALVEGDWTIALPWFWA